MSWAIFIVGLMAVVVLVLSAHLLRDADWMQPVDPLTQERQMLGGHRGLSE